MGSTTKLRDSFLTSKKIFPQNPMSMEGTALLLYEWAFDPSDKLWFRCRLRTYSNNNNNK